MRKNKAKTLAKTNQLNETVESSFWMNEKDWGKLEMQSSWSAALIKKYTRNDRCNVVSSDCFVSS